MKKIILVAGLLSLCSLYAKNNNPLPNGSFENWIDGVSYTGVAYHDMDTANVFWTTLNALSTLPPTLSTGPITAYREAGRSEGTYSAKVVSKKMMVGEIEILLPGVIGTIDIIFEQQSAVFGRAFTDKPLGLEGYVKYAPVNGDSAEIYIDMFANVEGKRRVVGHASYIIKEAIGEWTKFSANISYFSDAPIDSINVLCVSSAAYDFENLFQCQGEEGSSLWIDDLALVYGTSGETNPAMIEAKIFPNPASSLLNLSLTKEVRKGEIEICDLSGRLIKAISFSGHTAQVSLENMAKGMYTYRISEGKQLLSIGKFMLGN